MVDILEFVYNKPDFLKVLALFSILMNLSGKTSDDLYTHQLFLYLSRTGSIFNLLKLQITMLRLYYLLRHKVNRFFDMI